MNINKLFDLIPELFPIIMSAVKDAEKAYEGIANSGVIKKEKVMAVIKAILDVKNVFTGQDDDYQALTLNLIDRFIDSVVAGFNVIGIFKTSKKLDFTKIPLMQEGEDE